MIMSDPFTAVAYGGKINWIITLVGTLRNTRPHIVGNDARGREAEIRDDGSFTGQALICQLLQSLGF